MLISQRPLKKLNASYLLDVRLRTIENLISFCSQTLHTLYLGSFELGETLSHGICRNTVTVVTSYPIFYTICKYFGYTFNMIVAKIIIKLPGPQIAKYNRSVY